MADLISNATGFPGGPSSGTGSDSHDVTQVGGQDPPDFLGIPFSYSTGMGGSPPPGGQTQSTADPTNQPNQYPSEGTFTHVPLDGTGLPGGQGVSTGDPEPGGQPVTVTRPGSFLAGPVGGLPGTQGQTVSVKLSGVSDSTTMTQQYPATETITKVALPHDTGVSGGRVLIGGYEKGQRG